MNKFLFLYLFEEWETAVVLKNIKCGIRLTQMKWNQFINWSSLDQPMCFYKEHCDNERLVFVQCTYIRWLLFVSVTCALSQTQSHIVQLLTFRILFFSLFHFTLLTLSHKYRSHEKWKKNCYGKKRLVYDTYKSLEWLLQYLLTGCVY